MGNFYSTLIHLALLRDLKGIINHVAEHAESALEGSEKVAPYKGIRNMEGRIHELLKERLLGWSSPPSEAAKDPIYQLKRIADLLSGGKEKDAYYILRKCGADVIAMVVLSLVHRHNKGEGRLPSEVSQVYDLEQHKNAILREGLESLTEKDLDFLRDFLYDGFE